MKPQVVPSNGRLDDIARGIHGDWKRGKDAHGEMVDAYFAIGHQLKRARALLESDQEFGAWCRGHDFGFSQQWGHVLRQAAENEAAVREAVTTQVVTGNVNFKQAVKAVTGPKAPPEAAPAVVLEHKYDVDYMTLNGVLRCLPDCPMLDGHRVVEESIDVCASCAQPIGTGEGCGDCEQHREEQVEATAAANSNDERRATLEAELADGVSGKRSLEIQRELDSMFVDDHGLQPGDVVNDDGSITRAEDVGEGEAPVREDGGPGTAAVPVQPATGSATSPNPTFAAEVAAGIEAGTPAIVDAIQQVASGTSPPEAAPSVPAGESTADDPDTASGSSAQDEWSVVVHGTDPGQFEALCAFLLTTSCRWDTVGQVGDGTFDVEVVDG